MRRSASGTNRSGETARVPYLLYDCNLEQIWGRHDYTRAGHVPKGYDVDGDRRDELLIGLDCVNPDGTVRWTIRASDIPDPQQSYFLGHDDRRKGIDINGDGQPEQILALENFGVWVSDLKGLIFWRKAVPNHCGEACVGRFLAFMAR